jgi:hypothetical protein
MTLKTDLERVEEMLGVPKPCKDPKCMISTGICGSITAGKGKCDKNGYWEFPCDQCADYYQALEDRRLRG